MPPTPSCFAQIHSTKNGDNRIILATNNDEQGIPRAYSKKGLCVPQNIKIGDFIIGKEAT